MNLSAGQELHWDASLNPAALGNGALAFSYDDANRVKRIDVEFQNPLYTNEIAGLWRR